jgi:hypothetical protein
MKPSTSHLLRNTALGLAGMAMVVIAAAATTGYPVKLNDFLNGLKDKLTRHEAHSPEDRVYLQFDKPFYKPGDDIWFSAFVRDGRTMKKSGKSDVVHVELINPKGNVQQKMKLIASEGMGKGDFKLDAEAAGGIYKVRAFTMFQDNQKNPYKFEKELQVQAVVLPNLKMKLDFERKAYGSGDEVVAKLDLNTNENLPLANHDFHYVATLDGEQLADLNGKTDETGKAKLKLRLPQALESNDGLVNVMISYNGLTESISRSIPIVLNKITLDLLPEGGDLVTGLPTHVAFRALNEFGKPADISGVVVDDKGATVGSLKSFHMGMGSFALNPALGRSYKVKITQPEGITTTYDLPEALPRGHVMNIEGNQDRLLAVGIQSTETEAMNLVAQVRGEIYWMSEVAVKPGKTSVAIPLNEFPMGVCQLTLFDSKGIERCERMAFVNRDRQLRVDIKPGKDKYMPREKVSLTVKVTDERGMPMPAILSMSVVNDQLLSFADDKSGTILSQLMLEQDLNTKVEEPRFYFDPKEEKSIAALDLLMMTTGWRRFIWEDVQAETLPPLRHQGERAIVGGRIYDPYTGTGVANASIAVPGSNYGMLTDKEGKFALYGLDIATVNALSVSADGYNPSQYPLSDFNANLSIPLYKIQPKPTYYNAPMAAGGANRPDMARGAGGGGGGKAKAIAPMGKGDMKEFVAAPRPMKLDADVMEAAPMNRDIPLAENINDDIMDEEVAAMPAPGIEPEKRKKDLPDNDQGKPGDLAAENENKKNLGFLDGTVVDGRFRNIMAQDSLAVAEKQQPARYHRAREFASPVYASGAKTPATRTDFRETLYWNPYVKVDRTGKAILEFYASDEISSFRAIAEGIGMDGTVGRAESVFFTQLPFSMQARVPVEVASGDQLIVPIVLKNNTDATIEGSLHVMHPSGLEPISTASSLVSILAGQAKVLNLAYKVLPKPGKEAFNIAFSSEGHTDAFEQQLKIVSQGFPVQLSMAARETSRKYDFMIANPVEGSLSATFTAFPNVVTDLLKGIESILREPYGCFEQTSTSSYPNAMVLSYMQEQVEQDPAVMKQASTLLDKGYKRLTSYECSEKGYEWFGSNPPHEALTAYGLMQFSDYSKVYDGVDRGMVDRTAKWLLSRRDGKGGFQRSTKALDSFGRADEDVTNAYIVYALSEGGYKEVMPEAIKAYERALENKDPYQLALVANTMYNLGDAAKGKAAAEALLKTQSADGSFTGKKGSITMSGGQSLTVETTALAVMALIKEGGTSGKALQTAVESLVKLRSGAGGFGSTQGTILALKSMVAYSKFAKQTNESGSIEIIVNGKKVAETSYLAGRKEAVEVKGLEAFLVEGKNSLEVRYHGCKNALPYSVAVDYSTSLPAASEACVVDLQTKLSATKLKMGETVRMSATLKNTTNNGQPMTMAILGIPAGLSPQPWQLKEMQERKVFDYYEIIGNNVVAYYRQMTPNETRQINLDLKADLPGRYTAPASSAYLYYTAEYKDWTSLPTVEITN